MCLFSLKISVLVLKICGAFRPLGEQICKNTARARGESGRKKDIERTSIAGGARN